jgi:hypothetical protein
MIGHVNHRLNIVDNPTLLLIIEEMRYVFVCNKLFGELREIDNYALVRASGVFRASVCGT